MLRFLDQPSLICQICQISQSLKSCRMSCRREGCRDFDWMAQLKSPVHTDFFLKWFYDNILFFLSKWLKITETLVIFETEKQKGKRLRKRRSSSRTYKGMYVWSACDHATRAPLPATPRHPLYGLWLLLLTKQWLVSNRRWFYECYLMTRCTWLRPAGYYPSLWSLSPTGDYTVPGHFPPLGLTVHGSSVTFPSGDYTVKLCHFSPWGLHGYNVTFPSNTWGLHGSGVTAIIYDMGGLRRSL
jgi:hypothetical protein